MGSSGGPLTSIEICAGAGGQAVGLHQAGFRHLALVEIDRHACQSLRANVADHREWQGCEVIEGDIKEVDPFEHPQLKPFGLKPGELDLLAGGVPCPPFSIAGKQLGEDDERDLFPRMLQLVELLQPKAVMIENVRGILEPFHKFEPYRNRILDRLDRAGYDIGEELSDCWRILEAREYGAPQLRPRAILVALRRDVLQGRKFSWPSATVTEDSTVAEELRDSMWSRFEPYGARGKQAYEKWLDAAEKAAKEGRGVAPTLVGGSKKHGGADLGPSRAKATWAALGVNALGVANDPEKCDPDRDLFKSQGPMLTVAQAAAIQGFPPDWKFSGGKTARYRQVGNAFPPPVAKAVGEEIKAVLRPDQDRFLEHRKVEQPALFPVLSPAAQQETSAADHVGDLEGAAI